MKYSTFFALLLALFLGYGLHAYSSETTCFKAKQPHINQLLRCTTDSSQTVFLGEYEEFEAQLVDWIAGRKAAGEVSDAALYFRDLKAGPWFGIKEKEPFVPASLFKVPVMVAILKAQEEQKDLLKQTVVMSGAYTGLMNVEHPEESIEPGREYTITELLEKMIIYSDNASSDMLRSVLSDLDPSGDVVSAIYRDLGVLSTKNEGQLSAKSYASIFRVLYNARYLTPEHSEYALSLLSRSAFKQGIPAGVPKGIDVAHKFGVRDIPNDPEKQFHDCGIVYHPIRPYLLCVLTKSKNTQLASRFIRDLSAKIYEKIDSDIKKSMQNN